MSKTDKQEEVLPPGWKTARDPVSGENYYYNSAEKKTTWTHPSDYIVKGFSSRITANLLWGQANEAVDASRNTYPKALLLDPDLIRTYVSNKERRVWFRRHIRVRKGFPVEAMKAYCEDLVSKENGISMEIIILQFERQLQLSNDSEGEYKGFEEFRFSTEDLADYIDKLLIAVGDGMKEMKVILFHSLVIIKSLEVYHELIISRTGMFKLFAICVRLGVVLAKNKTYSNKFWGSVAGLEPKEVEVLDTLVCKKLGEKSLGLEEMKQLANDLLIEETHHPDYMI